MGRPTTYGRRVRVYLTPEHVSAIRREATLTGRSMSDVIRSALDQWLSKSQTH